MLEQLRAALAKALEERTAAATKRDAAIAGATTDKRDLTTEETTAFDAARSEVSTHDETIASLNERIAGLEDEARRDQLAADVAARTARTGGATVTSEPTTYRDNGDHSFFGDAFRASYRHDSAAGERLSRHQREAAATYTQRDATTANFGGLVVPQYLVDEFSEVLRNGRATANAVRHAPLPDEGMSLVIPRGQTGSSVTEQATQNAAVSETDVDFDNDLTVSVRTYAGQQDVSRQSLERGTPGVDRLLYADLIADYAETLDVDVINGSGAAGKHKGILQSTGIGAVTYTDATPTVAEIWPKLADAIQGLGSARKSAANLFVMHGRRWGWFLASLDTTNRPLICADPEKAMNAMGSAAAAFGEGQLVGLLHGIPVLVDNNVPTNLGAGVNEDRIILTRREDPILWEADGGMPRELSFDQTAGGNLTVKLVVYGYSAFTAERRPEGVSVIAGTGLVTPTF